MATCRFNADCRKLLNISLIIRHFWIKIITFWILFIYNIYYVPLLSLVFAVFSYLFSLYFEIALDINLFSWNLSQKYGKKPEKLSITFPETENPEMTICVNKACPLFRLLPVQWSDGGDALGENNTGNGFLFCSLQIMRHRRCEGHGYR